MKIALILAFLSFNVFADQNQRLGNLVGMLSSTPASLTGDIAVGSDILLGESRVPIGPIHAKASVELRKSVSMDYYLTENTLSLNTNKALVIKVAGVVFKINSISYNKNGHFSVDLNSPLLEKTLEKKVAAAIEERYKAKMDLAFKQLSEIRHQKTGRDAKAVIDGILEIFKAPGNAPSPFDHVLLSGNVKLNFEFPRKETLEVTDKYVADVQAGDQVSARGKFTRQNGKYNVSEIEFSSYKGVIFRPENKSQLALETLKVTDVMITDRGIEPTMVTGAEQTLNGIGQLVAIITSAQGVASLGARPDCDPRIDGIQQMLQKQLHGQLIPLIRQHRTALIQAGIDPKLLSALES
jgi:hypothetical protein